MRVTDLFLAVPQIVLALALTLAFRPSLETAILALSVTYWPHFCRTAFAETRRCRFSPFVESTRMLGGSAARILILHILPNIASPILVRMTVGMGYTILTAAMLGFLGVGVPPPSPEWGAAIAESRIHLPGAWWFAMFPGLAIFFLVLGFNLLGDGLLDVLNPRLRRSK
jgi:peptide/nickel transport system permease protein